MRCVCVEEEFQKFPQPSREAGTSVAGSSDGRLSVGLGIEDGFRNMTSIHTMSSFFFVACPSLGSRGYEWVLSWDMEGLEMDGVCGAA